MKFKLLETKDYFDDYVDYDFIYDGKTTPPKNIRNVLVQDGVKLIKKDSFKNTDIETIVIPDSVKRIGSWAFHNCANLQYVELSNRLEEIRERSFQRCSQLKTIVIPGSVKKIDCLAFSACRNLNSVEIRNGVQVVGWDAFEECNNLFNIEFRGTIKQWEAVEKYNSYPHITVHCTDGQTQFR